MSNIALVDPTAILIKNLIILDHEGKRIAVKYYSEDWTNVKQQSKFEEALFTKTSKIISRGEAEVIIFDDLIVLFKIMGELTFFITSSKNENELILMNVLYALYESINILLRGVMEKKSSLENLDQILLAMDEIIDGGLILETDPQVIATNVNMKTGESSSGFEVNFSEHTLSQAFATAKETITRSLLK